MESSSSSWSTGKQQKRKTTTIITTWLIWGVLSLCGWGILVDRFEIVQQQKRSNQAVTVRSPTDTTEEPSNFTIRGTDEGSHRDDKLTSSIAETVDERQEAVEKETSSSSSSSCNYGQANGYFEDFNQTGAWKWNSNDTDCPVRDFLGPIQDKSFVKTPLSFLYIGDSLDYHHVSCVCFARKRRSRFRWLPTPTYENVTSPDLINRARSKKLSSAICSRSSGSDDDDHGLSFSFFKIHGMAHDCDNDGVLAASESRRTNSTAERIRRFLPVDILDRLDANTTYVPMVSSSLWDLSAGCNNHPNVSEDYQQEYREGIISVHAAIRDLLPTTTNIYWRTSPTITIEYERRVTALGAGRTRGNQETLNRLLRETVETHNLGTVIDWWAQSKAIPEAILTEKAARRDGRHYLNEPSFAFINLWMNAVFDKDPSLLLDPPNDEIKWRL